MKKSLFLYLAICFPAVLNAEVYDIVPEPLNVTPGKGYYSPEFPLNLSVPGGHDDGITFRIDRQMEDEAYRLSVTRNGIEVVSKDDRGAFYALQTLRQMLPAGYEDGTVSSCRLPAVEIYDKPRFPYRGFMLDVARFFTPKDDVLKIIDCMAMLKLNKLHLHLCDDNGWRLEIKKYPLLHEIGSCRVDRPGEYFSERKSARQGEPVVPGGYYTQDDIREIVAYAAERQIDVIPEIEMPAHSNAALAAYPLLACPVVDKYIGVLPGLCPDHADILFCAGNEEVYSFIEDVLYEVMDLFPSQVIHIGGDEATKTYWKQCPLCQKAIKDNGLKDEEELQGYFMARIAAYLQSKGREVAGWDELAETGVPENAILYGWRGLGQAAVEASRSGHRFVMTPARIAYLIRYQGPQWFEPLTYFGNNRLSDIYNYEPVGDDWTTEMKTLLMGVQASLWTEFCHSVEDVNYLIFPRLAALAEIGWTAPELKDWNRFQGALDDYLAHIERMGIEPARSMFNIQHTVMPDAGKLEVLLECERTDVEIRYTVNGTEPGRKSHLYVKPLSLASGCTIKCATFRNGQMMGKVLTLPVEWNAAIAAEVSGLAGGEVLVNGLRGSLRRSDFEWVALPDDDICGFCLDLGVSKPISYISVGCINDFGMSVHLPASLDVFVSENGDDFVPAGSWKLDESMEFAKGTFVKDIKFGFDAPIVAKYVKFAISGQGTTPRGHCRPNTRPKVYLDEIILR